MSMQRKEILPGMLAQDTQPSSKEAEAGGLLESEPLSVRKYKSRSRLFFHLHWLSHSRRYL